MSDERPDKLVKYFEGRPVEFRSENGKLWLTMREIGAILGYESPETAISKLFATHRDEFDNDCTEITHIGYPGEPGNKRERKFSLEGLILVCVFSEKPIAKKFRAWLRKVGREVMTTGHYELPGYQQAQQAVDAKVIAEAVAAAVAQAIPQAMTVAFQMMDKFMEQRTFAPAPTPLLPASGIPDVVSLVQFPQTTEAHPMTVEWERLHWTTATQWVRRNVPDRHIPSHFNMGKAFDNFVAKRHAETFNESPRLRKYPIELGNRSAEWVYPIGDETSRFLRQCFKEHISLKFSKQPPLPF